MPHQSEFTVTLERVFQGPMDLLLHLVREQEVDIQEVAITPIITGYLEYMNVLEFLDIELAGDFLVMASTLMAVKARSLLPREEVNLAEELDPRDELIQRLLEYRRFKDTSEDLHERMIERSLIHGRGNFSETKDQADRAPEPTLDLGELTIWDLLSTFSRLMRETGADRVHHVAGESRPLRFYVRDLAHRIRRMGHMSLRQALLELDGAEEPTRESLIGGFCAILELVKMGLIAIQQESQDAEIELEVVEDSAEDIDDIVRSSIFDDEVIEAPDAAGEAEQPGSSEIADGPDGPGEPAEAPESALDPTEQPPVTNPAQEA